MLMVLLSSSIKGQVKEKDMVRLIKYYYNLKAEVKHVESINKARWILSNNDRYVGHFNLNKYINSSFPSMSNDTIFVAKRDSVFCFNGVSGEKYWGEKYPFTSKIWQSKTNIVITGSEKLRGVNKKTGETVWTDNIYKVMNRKYNREKNLIFLSKDSLIVGLDAKSGKKVWEYKQKTPLHLLMSRGNILLGKREDSLHCIDLLSKKIKWKRKIEKCRKINSSNDQILFDTRNDSIIKLNLENGKLLMGNSAKDQSNAFNLLSTSRGIIAKVIGKEEIFLWDVKSGKTIWTYKIPNQETLQTPYSKRIGANKKTLFINTKQGILRAIHLKTGKLLWEFDTYKPVASSLLVGNGMLYMINSTGQVIAIDTNLKDGVQKWKNVRDF